jgi:hypothetical protein
MQSNETPESQSEQAAYMPEPLNVGTDLAAHAYAISAGATVMTAMVGDNPSDRNRRNIKRFLRDPGYDDSVKFLLDPDVSAIHHHQRGTAIYLRRPERINDDGDRLTAYHMGHERAAKALVALACARGWTSIVFNGPPGFVLAAMREAVAQGMPVHPRDAGQRVIWDQVMAEGVSAMGTVAMPVVFVPPEETGIPLDPQPESPQPAPVVPVVSQPSNRLDFAQKLALRRQQRESSNERQDNESTPPKGPKGP